MLIFEIITGGFILGFTSLSIPVAIYNETLNQVETISVFTNFLLFTVTKLPIILILSTFALTLSVIIPNTAFSLSITFASWIASSIINSLAINYNIEFLKYFVTLNWDFSAYLFGGIPSYEYINLLFSLVICVLYELVMLIISYFIFKKKNVKNI